MCFVASHQTKMTKGARNLDLRMRKKSVRKTEREMRIESVLVGVVVMVVMVMAVCARCADVGLLDGLNAVIAATTRFKPFYAGMEGLPLSIELYPELARLEKDFEALQVEVTALLSVADRVPTMDSTYNNMFLNAVSRTCRSPPFYKVLADHGWRLLYGKHIEIFNKIASPHWRTLNLIVYGQPVLEHVQMCPRLCAHLIDMKCVQTALLSFMLPGANIPAHTDPATGVLRYHLAFKVPKNRRERCFMLVDNKRYVWEEGKSVIFDTVYPHSVTNSSDECRIVLFMDLHRPLRGAARWLQNAADFVNSHSPGTRAVVRESESWAMM